MELVNLSWKRRIISNNKLTEDKLGKMLDWVFEKPINGIPVPLKMAEGKIKRSR
jgi:hypothetical protein